MQMLQNRKLTHWKLNKCDNEIKREYSYLVGNRLLEINKLFVFSWLEIPPRWADGAVGYRRGLPPADGGHPPRDRQLCPPLLLWPCKQNASKPDRFRDATVNLHPLYIKFFSESVNIWWLMLQDLFTQQVLCCMVVLSVASFSSFSTRGCAMLPAMPLDRWLRTLRRPSKRNSMIRYAKRRVYTKLRESRNRRAISRLHSHSLQVISALLQTMEDQSNPRVQAHAAAALINFTEDCPKSLLIPYLDSLVQHLHVIMVAKLQEVQIFTLILLKRYNVALLST